MRLHLTDLGWYEIGRYGAIAVILIAGWIARIAEKTRPSRFIPQPAWRLIPHHCNSWASPRHRYPCTRCGRPGPPLAPDMCAGDGHNYPGPIHPGDSIRPYRAASTTSETPGAGTGDWRIDAARAYVRATSEQAESQ